MASGDPSETIRVEVAFAQPEQQLVLPLDVTVGTTAIEAIRLSGIEQHARDIVVDEKCIGVFGRLVQPEYILQPFDRVEIYRPLKADPKEVRRQLAAIGKTMGRKG